MFKLLSKKLFAFAILICCVTPLCSVFAGSEKPEQKKTITAPAATKEQKSAPHGIKALVVSCVDYRLAFDDLPNFVRQAGLMENADLITIPGASLGTVLDQTGHVAAMGNKSREEIGASFNTNFKLLHSIHHFKEIYVIDHRDCGMYKAIYDGKDGREAYHARGHGEKTQHGQNMLLFKKKIAEYNASRPGEEPLTVRFFLMDIVEQGKPIKYQEIKFTGDTMQSMVVLDNPPLIEKSEKNAAGH